LRSDLSHRINQRGYLHPVEAVTETVSLSSHIEGKAMQVPAVPIHTTEPETRYCFDGIAILARPEKALATDQ
jgi:hypothetical protein